MTVQEALSGSGLTAREARLLLAAATGFSEASVLAHVERVLPKEALQRFLDLAERRRNGEPVAYLLGRKEFYGLEIVVNSAVLIPRPETELLVELALAGKPDRVLDLGTGSGAIALAIKKHLPRAHVVAVEASAAALAVAQRNAARLGLEIKFRHGHWLDGLEEAAFDMIVSNPPYVAEGDQHLADLRYEPRGALVAGPDGLSAIREIMSTVGVFLEPGGWLLLEHGMGQEAAVQGELVAAGLEEVRSWPDLAGIARVSGGKR